MKKNHWRFLCAVVTCFPPVACSAFRSSCEGNLPNTEVVAMKAEPVQATLPAAKKLFAYLHEIYGLKTLSSTMANVNWNTDEAELVFKATGKYPAIATFDYIHLAWSPAPWIDYTDTRVVEDWWQAGGIVSACWHWNVPCTEADMESPQHMTYTPGDGKRNSDGQQTAAFLPQNIFVDGSWERRPLALLHAVVPLQRYDPQRVPACRHRLVEGSDEPSQCHHARPIAGFIVPSCEHFAPLFPHPSMEPV